MVKDGLFLFLFLIFLCDMKQHNSNRPQACDCIHAPLQGFRCVLHVSEALHGSQAHRSLPVVLAAVESPSDHCSAPLVQTCCDCRLWQLFIRVICSHLAHDGQR